MARYQYRARDLNGKKVEGLIEETSTLAVITRLRGQQLFPVEVRLAGQQATIPAAWKKETAVRRRKVKLKELSIFTRQSAAMLEAGVAINNLLEDLSEQTSNRYFSQVLQDIRKEIREGSTFSQSIARYPGIFSPLYVALIQSGEESGNLAEVMAELAGNIEDQLALIAKLKQALSYPVVVSAFFIGVVSFVFLFLLPRFQDIFQDFEAQLPAFTLMIMGISSFLTAGLPYILLLLLALGISLWLFHRTSAGRTQIDRFKLRVPIFGPLMLKISLARVASALATLISGGVAILSALDIVSRTAGNRVIEQTMHKVREGVVKGSQVSTEMRKYRIFPLLFLRMVAVGEETGKTDEMLGRVARFFRDEVDATLNTLASMLEPVLIISLGIIVGIVVLAIYLPIFRLATVM